MSDLSQTSIKRPYFDVVINYRQDNADDKAVIKEMFIENVYRLDGYKLTDGGVVLDIGANIGLFTMQVLKLSQENNIAVTVYAVEPEANNLAILKKNLEDNPLLFDSGSQVVIIENGVSDFVGKSHITNGAGSSRLSDDEALQEIDVTTFDGLIESIGVDKIDFTKIDIEGSEVPLISSASIDNLKKTHYYAIECDRQNEMGEFMKILTPFLDDFSFETWGVPSNGCNLYLENHHWGNDA